jgi:glutamyl-tRNA reductase
VHWAEGDAAARHLLSVASGLDSMVVGEPQILGQVKDAHELALAQGACGRELTLLFHKAIAAGKRVRTETDLGKGAVSIGSAAVQLARRELRTLQGKRAVVVGTGAMASLVARALRAEGCEVAVVSRRTERAQALAAKVQGTTARHADLPRLAAEADVIVYATAAPRVLLDKAKLQSWSLARPRTLLVLDVANPRNVAAEVGRSRAVKLHNIDGLRAVSRASLAGRKRAAQQAEAIVEEELAALQGKLAEAAAEEVLRVLYERMALVRDAEVAKAVSRMNGAGEREREVVEGLANSLVNKILAAPTLALKGMARTEQDEALAVAAKLFGVEAHVPHPERPKAPPK